jgi:hypothetical protein
MLEDESPVLGLWVLAGPCACYSGVVGVKTADRMRYLCMLNASERLSN